MEFLRDLRIFSIPRWVKITIVAILVALGAINTIVFAFGLWDEQHREGWTRSSIDLLGVLLPVFLIALIAWQANTGIHALRRVTEDFFLSILPDVLNRITEVDAAFFDARKGHRLIEHPTSARILTNLRKGDCYADVLLFVPDGEKFRELLIRVEVNVRKINVNVCFDKALLEEVRQCEAVAEGGAVLPTHGSDHSVAKWLKVVFAHTLRGAEHPSVELEEPIQFDQYNRRQESPIGKLIYQFNERAIMRTICGRPRICLVAAVVVPRDFLWDSSERLYFAQDLMFALRSFLAERRDLFRPFAWADVQREVSRVTLYAPVDQSTIASYVRHNGP